MFPPFGKKGTQILTPIEELGRNRDLAEMKLRCSQTELIQSQSKNSLAYK
jgi:hypothetical protein